MAYGGSQAPQPPQGSQGVHGQAGEPSPSSAPTGGGTTFSTGRGGGAASAGLVGAAGASGAVGGGAKESVPGLAPNGHAGHAPPTGASYSDVLAAYSQPYSQLRPLQVGSAATMYGWSGPRPGENWVFAQR